MQFKANTEISLWISCITYTNDSWHRDVLLAEVKAEVVQRTITLKVLKISNYSMGTRGVVLPAISFVHVST